MICKAVSFLAGACIAAVLVGHTGFAQTGRGRGAAGVPAAPAAAPRVDYLTFAQGAIPLRVDGAAAKLGTSFEQAMRMVDGDPRAFVFTPKPGGADTDVEVVFELPALTTFDRFAVPDVQETPSPSQTFARQVEISGSATSATDGFTRLASGRLTTHKAADQITELPVVATQAVRWVKLRLSGGIVVDRPQMFLEFSEIIGNGTQQPSAFATGFSRAWKGRGVAIELRQTGAVVAGCYDTDGELAGTVSGSILRAVGAARGSGVKSVFVLGVTGDGILRGVRSTNGAPFALYVGEPTPAGVAKCGAPAATLGCGSIIHGINFDFDSAAIRPDSDAVLTRLFEGLRDDSRQAILIEGHTSSEGSDTYNADLSRRRAEAVLADLVRRGINASRLKAAGAGETRPLASNDNESGRALNRRVEVRCS